LQTTLTRATRTRKQGTLLYGYRITVLKDGYKSVALPTIFSPDVPELWNDLRSDETILSARLHRRGRLVDQYSKVVSHA